VVTRGLLKRPDILNAAELSGLWHLPDDPSGLPIAGRAAARRIVPANEEVARGCRVGVSVHQGRRAPAYLPHGLLFRNHLVVAKTRRGKSTLLVHIASYVMQRMAAGRERLLLVVVDPHQDLAEAVLGIVPSGLEDRVTYLNLADHERPVGLNPLDVTLFPSRDRTAGVNRFFVRLIRDGVKGGPRLVRWLSASEAAQKFTYGEVTHWLRPDGAGDVHSQGRVRRFYLEWDRGKVKWPDMIEKFRDLRTVPCITSRAEPAGGPSSSYGIASPGEPHMEDP